MRQTTPRRTTADYLIYLMVTTISHLSQCSTTGATKAAVCEMVHIKEPLLLIGKSSSCGSSGFTLVK